MNRFNNPLFIEMLPKESEYGVTLTAYVIYDEKHFGGLNELLHVIRRLVLLVPTVHMRDIMAGKQSWQ